MATPVYFCKSTHVSPCAGEEFTVITAVFPTLPASPGRYLCYEHIGQHSECSKAWLLLDTKPAWEGEYADLRKELEQVGYDDLIVCTYDPSQTIPFMAIADDWVVEKY